MEEIIYIHSIVHKKKKNTNKTKKNLSITQTTSKFLKNFNRHSSNDVISGEKTISNIKTNINAEKIRNFSQKNFNKKISLLKKYDFAKQNVPSLCTKNDNLKNHSEKELKREEESNTPVMNLQKNKKPNYLMKSAFIKDKSLTPQEKSFQNSSCPIYDFYRGNSGLSSGKNNELLPNTSFTQYYNDFKITNNPQVNDYYNPSPSPLTNLSDKNNMNYYCNFSFLSKNQSGKEFYEADKINEEFNDKSSSIDGHENNNPIYNYEKDENIEGNTPSNLGGTFSPSYDFFDENIFGNESNYMKSPINYKQMNVNININNNSQNNNIYYQIPHIIHNINNNANNNYYNNNFNNKELNNSQGKIDNYNNSIYQGNNQINNNINDNLIIHNFDNNSLKNNVNNTKNYIANIRDFNKSFNNQNNLINQTNYNSQIGGTQNISSIYNNDLDQNENNKNKNQLKHLHQNISNYLNQYSKINYNNININDIIYNKFRNNDNINYNINYNNKNINNLKNINFSSVANAYINQNMIKHNIYNNMNQLKMPIQNNSINNNSLYKSSLQYYLNQGKVVYQNNNMNNQNINNQMNNYSYMNNLNYVNNYNNYNNNQGMINSQTNNNMIQNTNNIISESFFYQLTPIQLAQNCHIIAKNQNGCRYLQNYISSNPELLKNVFFPKILEYIKEISNDQFANYLIKKIFQYLTEEMLLNLIQALVPLVEQIGTNQYGTRVIQDLIDFLNTDKAFMNFINIIIPHVKLLITDLNGSHIIYKLILTKNKRIKIIEDIICMQVKDIAITRKGCSFLKKYFEFEEEKDLIKIKQCILQNLKDIITDQYGNYVIQSILTKEGSSIIKDFINEINKNIVYYSNNKFSSNAVEKCFENENLKNIVLDQFIKKDIFEKIISDKFGNYVVQKAIANADSNRRNYMLQLIIPLIPSLKCQYFGQRLLSKLILQYPNLNISF